MDGKREYRAKLPDRGDGPGFRNPAPFLLSGASGFRPADPGHKTICKNIHNAPGNDELRSSM
jgi:hypothetical protein